MRVHRACRQVINLAVNHSLRPPSAPRPFTTFCTQFSSTPSQPARTFVVNTHNLARPLLLVQQAPFDAACPCYQLPVQFVGQPADRATDLTVYLLDYSLSVIASLMHPSNEYGKKCFIYFCFCSHVDGCMCVPVNSR